MSLFAGRQNELKLLKQQIFSDKANLVVINGRRRIGKSRLLREFSSSFEQALFFSGLPPADNTNAQDQRNEFFKQLVRQLPAISTIKLDISDWGDLFYALDQALDEQQVIIVLDEITWLGNKDRLFLAKLKNAWDLYFSQRKQLVIVLCGSLSGWIEQNIISSTGFLGRISLVLRLKELPMHDCAKFWPRYISAREILTLLSITGGVPRYLEQINPAETAEQNIQRLCFQSTGGLVDEFEHLFSDLFDSKSSRYQEIMQYLANGSREVGEISQQLNIPKSGYLLRELDDLAQAGFITKDYAWNIGTGKLRKIYRYRLSDNYSRFYLKYIQPNKLQIKQNHFRCSFTDLPQWRSIMGLQLENLVLTNRLAIFAALDLKLRDILIDNPYSQRKTTTHDGCQIDYLIQTRHHSLYVCEIKFSKSDIGVGIIDEVAQKIKVLKLPKHFSIRPVLIHCSTVSESVEDQQYFANIIDLAQLLTIDSADANDAVE